MSLVCDCRMSDSIVNKWLIVRYMVVGVYVGCVTVAGFAWWYMYYAVSPLCINVICVFFCFFICRYRQHPVPVTCQTHHDMLIRFCLVVYLLWSQSITH